MRTLRPVSKNACECAFKVAAAAFVLILSLSGSATGQSIWEVTPYSTLVWIALANQPDVPARWHDELPARIERRLHTLFRAVWDGRVAMVPNHLRSNLLHNIGELEADRVLAASADSHETDKIFLVSLSRTQGQYRIRVRQLDCQTHSWSRISEGHAILPSSLVEQICRGVVDSFTPLATIDRVEADKATVIVRASALVRDTHSPALLQKQAILQPVIRRNNRSQRSESERVRPIPWTYLTVASRATRKLECRVDSAFAEPLRARRSRATQRLAVAVQPLCDSTILRLESRDQTDVALVDYEVYWHPLESDGWELLGRTDREGSLTVPRRTGQVEVLLVRHGTGALAKLPVVPGMQRVSVARLTDDGERLAAQGFLAGAEATLVEMVARRETLAMRIRRQIERGQMDDAEMLLEEFRNLTSADEFRRQLEQRHQTLTSRDANVRRKIDTLFAETYQAVNQHLGPRLAQELQTELSQARASTD